MKRANNRLYGRLFMLLASGTLAASCNAILGINPIDEDGDLGPEPPGFSSGASPGNGGAPGTATMSASVTAAHAISSGGGMPGSTSGGGMPGSTSGGGMSGSMSGPTSTSTGGPNSTGTGGPTSTGTGGPKLDGSFETSTEDVLTTKDAHLEELDAKATIDGAIP